MAGKIALVGGDEFGLSCVEMDGEILKATGAERPRVLVVPTAAALERPSLAANNGVRYFDMLGADAAPLLVLNRDDANDEALLSAVDKADVIYLTGGNPSHLLDTLRESLLLQKMLEALERGAMLAGSSAGAMVMGQRMRFRQWGDALNITPGIVTLPHHERSSRGQTLSDVRFETQAGLAALGIDGATGCVSDGDGWRVLGAGSVTLYKGGDWEKFESGERFVI